MQYGYNSRFRTEQDSRISNAEYELVAGLEDQIRTLVAVASTQQQETREYTLKRYLENLLHTFIEQLQEQGGGLVLHFLAGNSENDTAGYIYHLPDHKLNPSHRPAHGHGYLNETMFISDEQQTAIEQIIEFLGHNLDNFSIVIAEKILEETELRLAKQQQRFGTNPLM